MNKFSVDILPDWKAISKIKNYKKKDFDNLLENYVKNKKEVYQRVKSIKKEDRNFENTILALENCDNDFIDKIFQISTFSITHKDKKYRDEANDFQKEISEKSVDLEYDKDIWQAIVEYKEGNYKKESASANLSSHKSTTRQRASARQENILDKKYGAGSAKLYEDIYKAYKKMGFDLPKSKQEKLKKIIKEISKLEIDFSKNISEYKDFILCSEEEMKGLPENFVQTLEKVDGKYKITLDYPIIGPFLQYADSRAKRKEITDKNYKKGGKGNVKILAQIVKLRDEKAKILGFKNFTDFKLEERMAKNETTVRKFVEGLIKKLEPKSRKNLIELNKFAEKNLVQYKNVKEIEYYDISYVANKLKEKKYSYDSSKIKEYFELEHTLKTMFSIFGELFNFSVSEVKDNEARKIVVDKEVRIYEFKDKKTKEILSYLILDLFPRDGKYGHACSAEFILGGYRETKRIIPINQLICNFGRPTKKLPSLLTLGEVETLFHELGHGLHYMFTMSSHSSHAGYNVVFDFVETPSQLLEEFLFEEKNLKKLALHYKTNKNLDKTIIKKIIESRNFLNSYHYLRQNILSLLDLDLHSNKIKSSESAKHFISLMKRYMNFDLPKDNIFPAGFGHMMNYAAGYYSYMWAQVYADDFYSIFKEVGNDKNKLKEIGARYRKEILEVGGSRDEMDSVKKFLKRKPNNKAFLKNI